MSRRSAKVLATRRLADGRRLVQIVCSQCDARHWIPEAPVGSCPRRRPGRFTIGAPK